jgi:hypothetical protein
VKEILLTRGKVALVDDDDYPFVAQHKWHAVTDGTNWYANHRIKGVKEGHERMHNFLAKPPPGVMIDHWDGNSLNNCRRNLRISTCPQNQMNRRKRTVLTSRFKGVSWKKKNKNWVAQIRADNKVIHLGSFKLEEDAARMYDVAAEKMFGVFAATNKRMGLL